MAERGSNDAQALPSCRRLHLFLMLPIYWLVNMSFKTKRDPGTILAVAAGPTLENYAVIFTDPTWYNGYINSIIYVVMNTLISVSVALPAAYAFSRYRFLGDKHLFFWLLTNRMAPPRCSRCRSSSFIRPSA
jgi:glycerol transport system permease protein